MAPCSVAGLVLSDFWGKDRVGGLGFTGPVYKESNWIVPRRGNAAVYCLGMYLVANTQHKVLRVMWSLHGLFREAEGFRLSGFSVWSGLETCSLVPLDTRSDPKLLEGPQGRLGMVMGSIAVSYYSQ